MKPLNLNNAEFIRSAASSGQFIQTSVPGIVFAGKSNVGKSSVINCLLNRKNFARVGNTPGKTIHVNYFLIDSRLYFIDLPGYGFANVAKEERDRWDALMESFFAEPDLFRLGVLILDARHRPTADDLRMFAWFRSSGRPFLILANKLDKLKKSEVEPCLTAIRTALELAEGETLIPFSAEKRIGRELCLSEIMKQLS